MVNPFLAEKKSWKIPVSALIMILLFVGAVLAAYIYSNTVTVTVHETYALTLEPENQTVLYYEFANFTATLTKIPSGDPIVGANITLCFLNGTEVDSGITGPDGKVALHWNATEVGTFMFQAYWNGTYS